MKKYGEFQQAFYLICGACSAGFALRAWLDHDYGDVALWALVTLAALGIIAMLRDLDRRFR